MVISHQSPIARPDGSCGWPTGFQDRMSTKPKVDSEQKEFDLSQNLLSKKSSSDKVAGKSAPECDHCAKQLPINSSRCSRCHSTFYCGRKCQRNGWKKHKSVCG
eukprot:492809_1